MQRHKQDLWRLNMTGRERFFAGILGALMPICAIVLTIDLNNIFSENSGISTGNLIGIAIQFTIFLFVGGTVAYMHSDEVKAYKLFQIGMATPALLASFTTSNGLNSAISSGPVEVVAPVVIESAPSGETSFNLGLISSAHASSDNPLDTVEVQQLAMGGESVIQQVWEGFTGKAVGNALNNARPKVNKNKTKNDSKKIKPPTAVSVTPIREPAPQDSETEAPEESASSDLEEAPSPTMFMAVEEPEATSDDFLETERLSSVETTEPSGILSVDDQSIDRYEQLIRRLEELETLQRQIQDEIETIRPSR